MVTALNSSFVIFPLGDLAATAELGKGMNEDLNKKALAMQRWFYEKNYPAVKDTIVAYSSLTIVYDPASIRALNINSGTAYQWIETRLLQAFEECSSAAPETGSLIRLPVCYDADFGFDMPAVIESCKLSQEEVIRIHTSRRYRVYMLGFLPGFAYLGELDTALHMPRKDSPVQVVAGSVGIAANQTGVYPMDSPGGWHIIGRTPVRLFDGSNPLPVKINAGDCIEFYEVSKDEYATGDWEARNVVNSVSCER